MINECFIAEDLLSLYVEDLLSDETKLWLENHIENCSTCKELLELLKKDLPDSKIESSIDESEMFKRINRKVSIYQFLFTMASFYMAMRTSLFNESFGFIFWYSLLGFTVYSFYKDIKIVCLLSAVPPFLFSIFNNLIGTFSSEGYADFSVLELIYYNVSGSVFLSLVHLLFAILGAFIAILLIKITAKED